jgi:hypothetical protein
MKLVRFLDLTFVRRTRGNGGTNVKSSALVSAVAERLPHAERIGFEWSRAIRGRFAPSPMWCRDNPKFGVTRWLRGSR